MLCGSVVTIEPTRIGRRAISNVCAPVPPAGLSSKIDHASFHHVQRLFELSSPSRPEPWTTSLEPRNSSSHLPGPPTANEATSTPTTTATAIPTPSRLAQRERSASGSRSPRCTARCESPSAAAAPSTSASANHAPARSRAARVWRSSTRPSCVDAQAADDRRGHAARDQHREALEAVARQRQPEADAERGDDEPGARVREHERDLAEIEEKHARRPERPWHGDALRRAKARAEATRPRAAQAHSSSPLDRASAPRGRRPGTAPGRPCRAAPSRTRRRAAPRARPPSSAPGGRRACPTYTPSTANAR